MDIVWFVLGLVSLIAGAGLLVRGAARLALAIGLSPLVVGLTIVSLGTSAPEFAVSIGSTVREAANVAVGNVIGSNICNILLILGLSAAITPMTVTAQVVRQEVPIMIAASLLLLVFARDGSLDTVEAGILLLLLVVYVGFLIWQSRRQTRATAQEYAKELAWRSRWDRHWTVQVGLMLAGLLLLTLGAGWLVDAAVAFAQALGVSDLVIGLTIVAVGTSLPELATSVVAAAHKERDIAIGNAVGSNIFNILGCLGAAGLAAGQPLPIATSLLEFDLLVMVAVAVACMPVFLTGAVVRWEGTLFLFYFVVYEAYVVLKAHDSDVLPSFRWAMLTFVVPLTAVTLLVSLWHSRAQKQGRPHR